MSKHTAAIIKFISEFDAGDCTTSDIADALKLSASRTRELLAAELKAGTVTRDHVEVDGAKVLVWFLPANSKAAKAAKPTKAKAPKKERQAATGKGHPDAKKSINPQSTLDLKKQRVEAIGGKMVYAGREWVMTVGKNSTTMTSRELAGLTADELVVSLQGS